MPRDRPARQTTADQLLNGDRFQQPRANNLPACKHFSTPTITSARQPFSTAPSDFACRSLLSGRTRFWADCNEGQGIYDGLV